MQYYIKRDDKVQGPISHEQLRAFAKQKKLKKSDLISNSKDGAFQKLETVWDSVKNSKPVPEVSASPAEKRIAVFDVETTGILPQMHNRIIEVAIVYIEPDGKISTKYDSLVNPNRDIGRGDIHGITSAELLEAPSFKKIADDIGEIFSNADLIAGHNVAFDKRFLAHEFNRLGIEIPNFDTFCTFRSYGGKLTTACQELGISMQGSAHRALTDAIATAEIVKHLIAEDDGIIDGRLNSRGEWPPFNPLNTPTHPREKAKKILQAPPRYLTRLLGNVQLDWEASDDSVREYLYLIHESLEDRTIDEREEQDIVALGQSLKLSKQQIDEAHKEFLKSLVIQAWADGVITPTEQRDLLLVSNLLGQSESYLEALIAKTKTQLPKSGKDANEPTGRILPTGLSVCFTGSLQSKIDGEIIERGIAKELSERAGFVVKSGVTKNLDILVVADPNTQSSKAKKARRYGTRIMSDAVFFPQAGIEVE